VVLPPQVTRAAPVPGAESCPGTGHRAVFALSVRSQYPTRSRRRTTS